jgi:hypothetical protein
MASAKRLVSEIKRKSSVATTPGLYRKLIFVMYDNLRKIMIQNLHYITLLPAGVLTTYNGKTGVAVFEGIVSLT